MNPYTGTGFIEFFGVLLGRIFSGQLFEGRLMSDEIQLATLLCCSLACGLLGPFIVLKRLAMFANSLSHTTLLGVVGAFLVSSYFWNGGLEDVSTLLIGAGVAALLTAALTELLARAFKQPQDASIGLVFSALFAIGMTLVTLFTNHAHLGVEAVMGHPDALRLTDLKLSALIACINVCVIALCHRKLALLAFDESCARVLGLSVPLWRIALYVLTTLTCIGAFRAVGVLVVLALLVTPYLTARLFCQRLGQLLVWTPIVGIVACAVGVAASRAILSTWGVALSTSGLIAAVLGVVFVTALGVKGLRARISSRRVVGASIKKLSR